MKNAYWTLESWGSDYPPENAEQIISRANSLIDAYAENHGEDEISEYSAWLWELYCSTNDLPAPYIWVDSRVDAGFVETYETEQEAIDAADDQWYHLTAREREKRQQFFVAFAPVDRANYDLLCGGWTGGYDAMIRNWKEG